MVPGRDLLETLKFLAPGTPLREGLENIVRARTGALIVVADYERIKELVDGGISIEAEMTPALLYELAKMDGAIILSKDGKTIRHANAQLLPDPHIPSTETGIRHRTAERVAKQTGDLAIAISQRRNVITLYKDGWKYALEDIAFMVTKANQAIQTLEKYKAVLDQSLTNLTILEFDDLVSLSDVVSSLQRIIMVLRVKSEIEKYISELGVEGRLVRMQLQELVADVDDEGVLITRDYAVEEPKHPDSLFQQILEESSDEPLNPAGVTRALGYSASLSALDLSVTPRGYRILRKIPRLPMAVIENLVAEFGSLQRVLAADADRLDEVEGIGEVRAAAIVNGLRRLREYVALDR